MTCAVLYECTNTIYQNQDLEVRKQREDFLANAAEYLFENIWQEERREYTQKSYLFTVFHALVAREEGLMF